MEPFLTGTETFLHGYTFGGHPVSTAVAMANLDIFEKEKINEHVRENEPAFRETLEKLKDLPIVGDVRGDGYFFGIELVKDKATKETFNDEESEKLLRGFLSKALYDAGLYCRADDRGDPVVQLAPPLICDQEHFDEMEQILREVLTEGRHAHLRAGPPVRASFDAAAATGGGRGVVTSVTPPSHVRHFAGVATAGKRRRSPVNRRLRRFRVPGQGRRTASGSRPRPGAASARRARPRCGFSPGERPLPGTVAHLATDHDQDRDHQHQGADDVDLHRDRLALDAPDVHRERRGVAGVQVGDDEVVERQREREQRRAEDAREDQREGDPPEGLVRRRIEIHRRLFERVAEPREPGRGRSRSRRTGRT